MEYSIDLFWRTRFSPLRAQTPAAVLPGWHAQPSHSPAFVEAALSLRADFNDLSQSVWLIAAPGAVGKSTLAREICVATKAMLNKSPSWPVTCMYKCTAHGGLK